MEFLNSAVVLPSCMTFLIFQLALPRNYPQISVTKKKKNEKSIFNNEKTNSNTHQTVATEKKQHKKALIDKQSHGIKTPRWRTVEHWQEGKLSFSVT